MSVKGFEKNKRDGDKLGLLTEEPDEERPACRKRHILLAFCVVVLTATIIAIIVTQLLNGLFLANYDGFLSDVNSTLSESMAILSEASWNYNTNLTTENQNKVTTEELIWNKKLLQLIKTATVLGTNGATEDQKRQLHLLKLYAGVPFDEVEQEQMSILLSDMQNTYSTAQYLGMPLTPDLENIMATSRNETELLNVWKGWRDVAGAPIRSSYTKFVNLSNIGARDAGFEDTGTLWQSGYDMDITSFDNYVTSLWEEVLPLYRQLHCYVRAKLQTKYQNLKFPTGFIPAHLLGNMWAQDWSNIADIVVPFDGVDLIDVTPNLVKQNYTAVDIHKLSESFFVSLGYDPLPESFWNKSMLVKPTDRQVVCHASAWDFGNNDLRIKMCTSINQDDMLTVHHEQGHLYYDHYYRELPFLYRDGANDGFHEAIGDTIQLSVLVPSHLHEIGLLPPLNTSYQLLINYQMSVALKKVAFLPFGYLIDQWRWKVFSGEITPENYNQKWWELRQNYQGISPPVERTENDFDPGAKFHVPANVPYIRYFLAGIYQFSFHEALCDIAGLLPSYNCSIYKNVKAGEQLKKMLELGKSKPWQEAMAVGTGSSTFNATAILEYFNPLYQWLIQQNNNTECGWPNTS